VYEVKLDSFQGPLDLLLYLVQKNEMNIYDIPIAEITRQYLEYLELMKMLDLEIASEFLVMAATLMQIKSQSMLPAPTPEQVEFVEGAREELIRQLIEYKKFKEAAQKLRELEIEREKLFFRQAPPPEVEEKEYLIEATLFDLLSALKDLLSRLPPEEEMELEGEEVTVEEKMEEIMEALRERGGEMAFDELFGEIRIKSELIVAFLAMLELIKLRRIIAYQTRPFGEITLRIAEG